MRRFGFLGRLAKGKGIPEILDALTLLKARGKTPHFGFHGTGPMEETLRSEIEERGLGNNVHTAPVSSPMDAVAQFDVLVLPSESEAMPLVIVEGLMAGRPCIATAVGGIPDLIRDGVEGLLLRDRTAEGIAEAMGRFMTMGEEEFAGFRRRARERYEACCTPEIVGAQLERIYEGAI